MRNLAVLSIITIAALAFAACGGAEPAPTSPTTPSLPTFPAGIDAQLLYSTNCAACHGTNRQGTPDIAPSLTPDSLADQSDAEIRDIITKGSPGTAMTGFEGRLSPEQIDALIQFLRR
ncbi:MAG: cytochrome c [Dehalococcoidales bacterium]|nr:cytochrome c [Dehalococcoidales bacterium]